MEYVINANIKATSAVKDEAIKLAITWTSQATSCLPEKIKKVR
jgi:hypothetical protein